MNDVFLGQYLIQQGLLSQGQLQDAIQYQRRLNSQLGRLAREKGFLTEDQVQEVCSRQKKVDLPFGEVAVQLDYLTRKQLNQLLKEHDGRHLFLGEALLAKGYLDPATYAKHMPRYLSDEKKRRKQLQTLLGAKTENVLALALYSALERTFTRFAHETLKIASVGDGYRIQPADTILRLRIVQSESVDIPCYIFFSPEVCQVMLTAVPADGKDQDNSLKQPAAFFRVVCRYLLRGLMKEGLSATGIALDFADGQNEFSGKVARTGLGLVLSFSTGTMGIVLPAR